MSRLRIIEFLAAFLAIGAGLVLLSYFVSSNSLMNYSYSDRGRAVAGALAMVGGGCVWLLARGKDVLQNRFGSTVYVVSESGIEESFLRRGRAEDRIRALRASGRPVSGIRLTKITSRVGDDGKLSTRTEDVPLDGT